MERTEPVNTERRVGLLLKIWLYPNVSSLKIVNAIPSLSDSKSQYASKTFSPVLLIALEFFILYRGLDWVNNENFKAILILLFIIHGLPEFIFSKKIDQMGSSYYTYYSNIALWGFVVFAIVGLCCMGLYFNDQIGHVK